MPIIQSLVSKDSEVKELQIINEKILNQETVNIL